MHAVGKVQKVNAFLRCLASMNPTLTCILREMHMTYRYKIRAVVVAASVLAALPASAADHKLYSPSFCHPIVGSDKVLFTHNGNSLQNLASAAKFAVCPVVRDDFSNGGGIFDATIFGFDGSSSTVASCTLFSYDAYGATLDFDARNNGAASNTGNYFLQFDTIGVSEFNAGQYAFACVVTQGGKIWSYRVNEHEDE